MVPGPAVVLEPADDDFDDFDDFDFLEGGLLVVVAVCEADKSQSDLRLRDFKLVGGTFWMEGRGLGELC